MHSTHHQELALCHRLGCWLTCAGCSVRAWVRAAGLSQLCLARAHCEQLGCRMGTWLAESLRRSVAFQWFLTAFSVRPSMTLAMSAHLLPTRLWAWMSWPSSVSLHASRLMSGLSWLCQRSRHCLPIRPGKYLAITLQFPWPCSPTNLRTQIGCAEGASRWAAWCNGRQGSISVAAGSLQELQDTKEDSQVWLAYLIRRESSSGFQLPFTFATGCLRLLLGVVLRSSDLSRAGILGGDSQEGLLRALQGINRVILARRSFVWCRTAQTYLGDATGGRGASE